MCERGVVDSPDREFASIQGTNFESSSICQPAQFIGHQPLALRLTQHQTSAGLELMGQRLNDRRTLDDRNPVQNEVDDHDIVGIIG